MSAQIRLGKMVAVAVAIAAVALSVIGISGVAEAKPKPDPIVVSDETGSVQLDNFCDLAANDAYQNARQGKSKIAAGIVREANALGCKIKLY
ncbi:hypothetical protein AB0M44_49610 [Streptosporangium subroseum]|uniref:hypothetical protein n=1 Tax=Streptosporangium subroseum TaxID=106412 RepID=UPI00343211BD